MRHIMSGIYFSNLSNAISVPNLLDGIIHLCCILGCDIDSENVVIKRKNQKTFAIVNLCSEEDVYNILGHLETWDSRKSIKFNFGRLTDRGQALRAAWKHGDGPKKKNRNRRKKHVAPDVQEENYASHNAPVTKLDRGQMGAFGGEASTPEFQSKMVTRTLEHKLQENILSTIAGKKYYIKGEKIGSETRSREFKQGGGDYPSRVMKEHVRKYICGFLNSGEEGKLMIGVHDNGIVLGIDCNQRQEDDYRLMIDESIKDIRPTVLPDMYAVDFLPVCLTDGRLMEDKQVIEITVKANEMDNLYETKDGVFFRRDGSLQGPLRAADIQEWTKKKFQAEVKHYRDQQQYMLQQLQNQQEKIQNLERTTLKASMKKSKTCCVM